MMLTLTTCFTNKLSNITDKNIGISILAPDSDYFLPIPRVIILSAPVIPRVRGRSLLTFLISIPDKWVCNTGWWLQTSPGTRSHIVPFSVRPQHDSCTCNYRKAWTLNLRVWCSTETVAIAGTESVSAQTGRDHEC